MEEVKEEGLPPESSPKKKERIKLKDRTKENDIKYRGPLSYRYLRIIAWVCIAFGQLGVVFGLAMKISGDLQPALTTPQDVMGTIGSFALPLFLMANFAFILQKKNDFKKLLFFYAGVALLMYLAALVLVTHYFFRISYLMSAGTLDFWQFSCTMGKLFTDQGSTFYVFNIFIDLLLCSLMYYFLFYNPKKHFQGKKISLFRLMILIPLLYEIGGIILKYLISVGGLRITYFLFFALPAKPPFMVLAFFIIIFVMKLQKMSFLKRHQSEELYDDHFNTNANSLKVSITMSWSFLLCGILDFLTLLVFALIYAYNRASDPEMYELLIMTGFYYGTGLGFGSATILIFMAPLALLFSYSKTHKNPKIDKFIPIGGIALIALLYFEGFYEIACFKFPQLIDWLRNLFAGGAEEEIPPEQALIHGIKNIALNIRNIIH